MQINEIGIVRNSNRDPLLTAGSDGLKLGEDYETAVERFNQENKIISEIIINENLESMLDGIEDYSHIIILYWGNKISEQARTLTRVHPMGLKDIPLQGIAATYSPARPNPILMTVVSLIKRDKNRLEVTGLDAIDGSPVVDIKPYVKELFPHEGVIIPDWMKTHLIGYDTN